MVGSRPVCCNRVMARQRLIFYLTICLTIFGLVLVGDASIVDASRDFGDKWYYLKLQSGWAAVGVLVFLFFSRWSHKNLENLAKPLLYVTIFLLLIVLIPGIGMKLLGARRWINLGFGTLQPAEVAKFTLILYLSGLFKKPHRFINFLFPIGLIALLVMIEPDLGTTLVIIGASLIMYFVGSGKVLHLLSLVPVAGVALAAIILFSPYRAARLQTFLNHSQDPLGSSYQIRQALIGLGSGGIVGVGLGQSRQKYEYLPEVTTDSIFAVLGEEMGFLGAACLIIIFLIFIYEGFQVSQLATNQFSSVLAAGLTSVIGIQVFLNLSSIVALTPFTGVPLPFISYGGSSLVIMLMAAGVLANIARTATYEN
jgi:cell division protein FtsW